ncbi:membrane protein [Vibrio sp. JCM 19236]|nr:membrane protein [Vibrio sp. JCM 19236]
MDWHWPYPQRFELLGIKTLGYKHDVVFPMTLHVEDMSKPTVLDVKLTLSSCTSICVLTEYPIHLEFTPNDLTLLDNGMRVYAQGMSLVPKPSPTISDIKAVWDQSKSQLQVTAVNSLGWSQPDVIVDGPSDEMQDADFSLPKISTEGKTLTATYDVSSWMGTPKLDSENIRVTLKSGELTTEHGADVSAGSISHTASDTSLAQMLLFALLGGLILNFMPCVFPVLGMKLSGIVSAQGLEKRQIKLQFLSSAAGILASFWLIAGFLTVLKLSGSAIGWGIQFQSGWFIGVMFLVTALFGANMLGLFEIQLSSNTSTWLASKGNNSHKGHFVQGMFATLLATPCSAPFLGTAVAFALGTNIPTLFGIFTALALGMALPWLLVALFPSIAKALPKPGAWMNKVKYLFAIMMLTTSIWLLSLLSVHVSAMTFYIVAGVFALLLMIQTLRVHNAKFTAIIAVVLSALVGIGAFASNSSTSQVLAAEPDWQPLSVEAIHQYVDEGKVVFVDVTADWCVTCKANKVGVLLQEPVYSTLTNGEIIPMQGDWTKPSATITDYLQSHDRFGVPFNVVYGPGAPEV